MSAFGGYAFRLGAMMALVWVLGGYPVYIWGGEGVLVAAIVGCGIGFVNALVVGAISLWALNKDHQIFMQALFGGMLLRLFIILVLFFIVLKLVKLHVFGLTLSLFLFYILFQVFEIHFFTRRPSGKPNINKEI